jgi:hypothetical protein
VKGAPLGIVRGPSRKTAEVLVALIFLSVTVFAKDQKEPDFGVLRVWLANSGQVCHMAGPDDVVVVEVKDFSGWIVRQVEIRGYLRDKAIEAASEDVKRVIREHAFEEANAAADALVNAVTGDISTLNLLLGKDDFDKYARALLVAEGKWVEGQDKESQLRLVGGRRTREQVIGPLFQTALFNNLRNVLPQENQKQPDIPNTLKLLEGVKECSQLLIRTARGQLHPKIDDLTFESITPLNADSAVVDKYRRPKASPLSDYEWFRFRLVEDSKTAEAWAELRHSGLYKHDINFTLVTPLGDQPIPVGSGIQRNFDRRASSPADPNRFLLQIASPKGTVIAICIFALIGGVLFWLGIFTDLVSDHSGVRRPDGIRPYSLARAQMSFWFLVIIGASLFLWIATGTWHILNDTCLWLIGIGSGTALGSAIIGSRDSDKASSVANNPLTRDRAESLEDFKKRLDAQINQASTAASNETANDAAIRLARRDALLKQREDLGQMPKSRWGRLIRDWLTDGDVYSFHRYQMLAWTLVLGFFFISKVWYRWELPTFDTPTLALLGITSGTYLGFKLQKTL